MDPASPARRRPRSLALGLVEAIEERIRDGRLAPGAKLPTESAVMAEFGVSRTVVREAISKLQASGRVSTRHGVGSFVVAAGLGNAVVAVEPSDTADGAKRDGGVGGGGAQADGRPASGASGS